MAGKTEPKDPVARECGDKVRQLQRQLWAAAKRAPGRRFHALYGQMCREDVLHEAWKRVRRNKGAAGVDWVTISHIEQHGVRRFVQELGELVRYADDFVVMCRTARGCEECLGLHRLRGTIRYPGKHNSWQRETA